MGNKGNTSIQNGHYAEERFNFGTEEIFTLTSSGLRSVSVSSVPGRLAKGY